jgi:nicotinamidase-related amidase
MDIDRRDTALVIVDPQNDFLSPDGATWALVGNSVTENDTVAHIEDLIRAAKSGGGIENLMHEIDMFARRDALSMDGFEGSGADWLERYKPLIADGETVITSPHKVYGPASNDLSLQLRKRGIDKVVLAGMSANLCVEAHLRQLLEDGFEVVVVKDATAAAQHPELGDGYQAALVNFGFLASAVLTTDEATAAIGAGTLAGA